MRVQPFLAAGLGVGESLGFCVLGFGYEENSDDFFDPGAIGSRNSVDDWLHDSSFSLLVSRFAIPRNLSVLIWETVFINHK